MTDLQSYTTEELQAIKSHIHNLSEVYVTSVRDIILHFQALISARAHRLMMEAPGLYYPDLSLYVVSKSGMTRGHTSMHKSIIPVLPKKNETDYAFVLYPESFVRTCLDRILRKSTKNITRDLRVSMENVYNRKHYNRDFTDSPIEKDLIKLLQNDL